MPAAFSRSCDAECALPVADASGFLPRLNPPALGVRRKGMKAFLAVLFTMFVVAMGALEVASSRAAARIADYPDPPSVSPSPTFPSR